MLVAESDASSSLGPYPNSEETKSNPKWGRAWWERGRVLFAGQRTDRAKIRFFKTDLEKNSKKF